VIITGCGRVDHVHNPFQAEVISCMHGVQAAIDIGTNFVEMETYALMVKQAILSNAFDISEVGGLVRELKELLLLNFKRVSVEHTPRNCNKAAHALTALGMRCEVGTNPILDVIPNCIQNSVVDDISI
jgi:hypothetical protein